MADVDLTNLADRYVAGWSEPDEERRRAAVRGVGLEILVLGADGRIVSDHQFVEG
jgi:hypothetical protein